MTFNLHQRPYHTFDNCDANEMSKGHMKDEFLPESLTVSRCIFGAVELLVGCQSGILQQVFLLMFWSCGTGLAS